MGVKQQNRDVSISDYPKFHLGISMAGAVSAGAYTAGFMDYLLEALSAWELAKDKNRTNEGNLDN